LRTLRNLNLNATSARKAHGHFYDDDDAALLRAAPAAAAAADAAAAAGNRPMQGQGGRNIQRHSDPLPALLNPPTPDLQIDTRPRVQSSSDSAQCRTATYDKDNFRFEQITAGLDIQYTYLG
jgi:hypothetical protein